MKKTKKSTKPKTSTKTKSTTKSKKPTSAVAEPKRTSALDAAAQVLVKAGKPMRAQELIAAMTEQGLWSSPAGKTPHATLHAAITREIGAKGKEARFTKADRGLFELRRSSNADRQAIRHA
jgi:hypothetical protein